MIAKQEDKLLMKNEYFNEIVVIGSYDVRQVHMDLRVANGGMGEIRKIIQLKRGNISVVVAE